MAFDYITKESLNMKKILSIAFALILIAGLFCGCSKPDASMTESNVKKTVSVAFKALKSYDTETLETYVKSSTLSKILSFSKGHDQFVTLGKAIFSNLSYEIKEIDLDASTVTLSVTNKEFTAAAGDFADKLLKEYSLMELLPKLSDDGWLNENLSVLVKSIDGCSMRETPVDITLKIKEGADNLVLRFDADAEDAVSGGALKAISGIAGI